MGSTSTSPGHLGSRLAALIRPLLEDLQPSNFFQVETSDSSKTINVVDSTLVLPRSSSAEQIRPLPEDHQVSELQVEVLNPSKSIHAPVGIFSLPTELICHVLLLLHFKDLSRCVLACKTFWRVAQNSSDIQCLLEHYAEGFTEAPTLDWFDVSSKMYSFKKLASMWRSDFHLNNEFEDAVAIAIHLVNPVPVSRIQSVKCGLWWMYTACKVFIRGCDSNTKLAQVWSAGSLVMPAYMSYVRSVVIDPLQDLVVVVSSRIAVEQNRHVFSVAFWSVSSRRPHPDSACASLECKHPCYMAPDQHVFFVGQPAICGDRIVALYYTLGGNISSLGRQSNIFIQVIDWRKGLAKGYPLYELGRSDVNFHLLDEQMIIVISPDSGRMALYTLQGFDGSPRRRIVYVLPVVQRRLRPLLTSSYCVIHATPSFHGAAARPDLIPDYVTSLEAQIMVLEVLSDSWQVILVIDMAIFSAKAVNSEIPVEVPWSEWGPKYARCFPHHPSHRISVFGRKMAYALPQYRAPKPGQRLEELPTEGSFYVHIWDFNRAIARSERPGNIHDRNSPDRLICRPGRLAQTCFEEDIGILNMNPYTIAVCPTGFSTRHFDQFFLEYDRLTLTWAHPDSVHIQVVSPSSMEVGLDVAQAHSPEPHEAKQMQSRYKSNILFYLLTKLRKRSRNSE